MKWMTLYTPLYTGLIQWGDDLCGGQNPENALKLKTHPKQTNITARLPTAWRCVFPVPNTFSSTWVGQKALGKTMTLDSSTCVRWEVFVMLVILSPHEPEKLSDKHGRCAWLDYLYTIRVRHILTPLLGPKVNCTTTNSAWTTDLSSEHSEVKTSTVELECLSPGESDSPQAFNLVVRHLGFMSWSQLISRARHFTSRPSWICSFQVLVFLDGSGQTLVYLIFLAIFFCKGKKKESCLTSKTKRTLPDVYEKQETETNCKNFEISLISGKIPVWRMKEESGFKFKTKRILPDW